MSYINNVDEYETIELVIGQKVKYLDSKGIERTGEFKSFDEITNILTISTGMIIKYDDYIEPEDLIEG